MKKGWETKKLRDACLIRPPKSEVTKNFSVSKSVSFVPMKDLGIDQKYLTVCQSRPLREVAGSYTYFAENDVLLAKITPCFENGKLGIAKNLHNGIGFGSSEYIVFRPKEFLRNEFLYYFLSREQFRQEGIRTMSGAVGHKRVAKDFIENYLISLPPLPEQKRIVGILDKAFEKITKAKKNAERNLENAHELFESYLQGIFANPGEGWEEKKLGEITTKIGSGATPRGGKKAYKKEGISLIRSLNVYDYGFSYKDLAFIDECQADKLSNVIVESGDVLLNITGASVARCTIVADDVLPARVNQHVSILRLKKSEMVPEYLHFALISKEHKDQLLNTGEKAGATRQALTKAQLEEYCIRYPKIPEQKHIVAKLDALSAETKKLEAIYRQKIADLEELKKSVLQKAFNGKLAEVQS